MSATLISEAADLIRERTADGEPLWMVYDISIAYSNVMLLPSDQRLLRRYFFRGRLNRPDDDFFERVAAVLHAQSPSRGRVVVPVHLRRLLKDRRARRARNKRLRAAWRARMRSERP